MATVIFKFEDEQIPEKSSGKCFCRLFYPELTEDHDVHLNHNCGGVCACSTCHIYVLEGENDLEEISDKEEDFIDRATNPRLNSRLGCQCIILSDEAKITVQIPDQSRIIGHEHD
ncbi:MAG: 2Fe-2S iron-sulfur cluster binding domain-containing protein [Saprospiraceae bacterium]|nr:2Fe-2S iron-sulfur cluster binding domain-containing protein [Saprospiraceae bacterium]